MTILNLLKPLSDLAIDAVAAAVSELSLFLSLRVSNLPPLSSQNRRVALAISISPVVSGVTRRAWRKRFRNDAP